jgi:hypothetical protein
VLIFPILFLLKYINGHFVILNITLYISYKGTFFIFFYCEVVSKQILIIFAPEEAEIFKDYLFILACEDDEMSIDCISGNYLDKTSHNTKIIYPKEEFVKF